MFTRTPRAGTKVAAFVNDPINFTKKLLSEKGSSIWLVGGSEIIEIFMKERLISDFIISMHPRVLGDGLPLFGKSGKEINLSLVSQMTFNTGLVQLHFRTK